MSDPDALHPAEPEDEGVEEEEPPPMQYEGSRLLANEVRPELRATGFSDHQIDAWAETFIAEFGDGEAEDLLAWMAEREHL